MNSTTSEEDTNFVKDTLPYWSDGISFLLLGLMYVVLPTPPTRRLWQRTGETVLWGSIVLSNLGWLSCLDSLSVRVLFWILSPDLSDLQNIS